MNIPKFIFEKLDNLPFYKRVSPKEENYLEIFENILKIVSFIITKNIPDFEFDSVKIKNKKTKEVLIEIISFHFYLGQDRVFKKTVRMGEEFINAIKRNCNAMHQLIEECKGE